jgi:hypothetical protein
MRGHPPEPVFKAGRRKAACTVIINKIKFLMKDSEDGNLVKALIAMEEYKHKLETV